MTGTTAEAEEMARRWAFTPVHGRRLPPHVRLLPVPFLEIRGISTW